MRITVCLFLTTLVVSIIGDPLALALYPIHSQAFQPWQLLSYTLVHGNALHLLVNLVALVSFGPALERAWGRWRFLSCYVVAAMIGGALQAAVSDKPVVGASAALFGLFAAYVMNRPKAKVLTLWPVAVHAWKVLTIYLVLTVAAWVFGWASGVAHVAHLGGMIVGLSFAINNKPRG